MQQERVLDWKIFKPPKEAKELEAKNDCLLARRLVTRGQFDEQLIVMNSLGLGDLQDRLNAGLFTFEQLLSQPGMLSTFWTL